MFIVLSVENCCITALKKKVWLFKFSLMSQLNKITRCQGGDWFDSVPKRRYKDFKSCNRKFWQLTKQT